MKKILSLALLGFVASLSADIYYNSPNEFYPQDSGYYSNQGYYQSYPGYYESNPGYYQGNYQQSPNYYPGNQEFYPTQSYSGGSCPSCPSCPTGGCPQAGYNQAQSCPGGSCPSCPTGGCPQAGYNQTQSCPGGSCPSCPTGGCPQAGYNQGQSCPGGNCPANQGGFQGQPQGNYFQDNRSFDGQRDSRNQAPLNDRDLEKKIRDDLRGGWFTKGYEQVSVNVQNGIVTLRGFVISFEDKEALESKIRNYDGVRQVNSRLSVKQQQQQGSDQTNVPNGQRPQGDLFQKNEIQQDESTTPSQNQQY